MSKGQIIRELRNHRKTMPRQTLKTIRGQAIAGDVTGAKKGLDREIKKLKDENCFAYKNNRCTALKVKNCEGCNFYKTKDQQLNDKERARQRVLSLNKNTKRNIIDKYYKGKMKEEN